VDNCIFCKIIKKENPSEIVYENDKFIAFNDIHPAAPIHILIIPKRHIISVAHLKSSDKEMIGELILIAKKIAEDKKIDGYKLAINVGRKGGQIVDHIHLHLLADK